MALKCGPMRPQRADLRVDLNKSTWIDLGIRSRVGSILLGAVATRRRI